MTFNRFAVELDKPHHNEAVYYALSEMARELEISIETPTPCSDCNGYVLSRAMGLFRQMGDPRQIPWAVGRSRIIGSTKFLELYSNYNKRKMYASMLGTLGGFTAQYHFTAPSI